jgi:hypothetical protein
MAEDVLVDVEINHRFAIVLALTQANIVIKRVSTGRTLWAIFPPYIIIPDRTSRSAVPGREPEMRVLIQLGYLDQGNENISEV